MKRYGRVEKYNDVNDLELITLAQKQNDHRAIEVLLCRYKNIVRAIARRFYITTGDIEDLVQEGMITLYNAILSYVDTKITFKSYLSICIERKMISIVRAAQGKKNKPLQNYLPLEAEEVLGQTIGNTFSPEEEILHTEAFFELLNTMRQYLSQFEYATMQLYAQGLAVHEIATMQNSTLKSVDNALQRAKKKLRSLVRHESSSFVSKIQT